MAQDLFRTERGDRLSWTAIYYMAFKATLDSHLRTFQFKIINRILITNRQLKLYQIKNSERCEFCRVETETYEHLFFCQRNLVKNTKLVVPQNDIYATNTDK